MPHAYEAGSQTELLKAQVDAMALFEEGWARHDPGMIDWIWEDFGSANVSGDLAAMTLDMDGDVMQVDVCNVIPAMKAGRIADSAGVAEGKWAPMNAVDMSSKVDPDNYVLGDASQEGDMPKSGFHGQFAGQGLRECRTRRADRIDAVSGALREHLLEPDQRRIRSEGRTTYELAEEKIARVDRFSSQVGESDALRRLTY